MKKTLITFAALAALTLCSLEAQQTPAPAKAEQTLTVETSGVVPIVSTPPILTEKQKLTIRDAQFAAQQFSDYMTKVIQPQLDRAPDYLRFKEAARVSNEAVERLQGEVAKTCPDCKIDYNSLTVTKSPPKEEEKAK